MEDVVRVLTSSTSGVLPRRAAVAPDGTIVDRGVRPELTECHQLSQVCALLRQALGMVVYPRESDALFVACVRYNTTEAWSTLYNDGRIGCLDASQISSAIAAEPSLISEAMTCLTTARDAVHLLSCTSCLGLILPLLSPASVAGQRAAEVASARLFDFVEVFLKHGRRMNSRSKEAMLTALGRLLARIPVHNETLANALETILSSGRDELLRLFLHVPLADVIRSRPHLFVAVLNRAKLVPPSQRYPPLGVVLRCVRDGVEIDFTPESVAAKSCVEVCMNTLRGLTSAASQGADPRLLLVVSLILKYASMPSSEVATMAQAIECTSAAILHQQQQPV
jgi:hypothetical protein